MGNHPEDLSYSFHYAGKIIRFAVERGTYPIHPAEWGIFRGEIGKTRSVFDPEIADRFLYENRSPFFPEKFLIGIAIAITIRKSLIDFKMKIAIRF